MAYIKAKEELKWKKWKAKEEKILRELGMEEDAIEKLRESDWEAFNSERRYRERQITSLLKQEKYGVDMEEGAVETIEQLLDMIEDKALFQVLMDTDRITLQIIVFKMMGYSTADIERELGISAGGIYCRICRIKKKIKKLQ